MIGLFGSAAGRAIAHQSPLNRQNTTQRNNQHNNNNKNFGKHSLSKTYKSLSNMTAKSKSLDYELIGEKTPHQHLDSSNNLAKIHHTNNGKKSKFWKIFESDKVKNSLEDISTASSKNR